MTSALRLAPDRFGTTPVLPGSAAEPANELEVQRILDAEYPPHLLGYVPVTLSHQVSRRPEDGPARRRRARGVNGDHRPAGGC